MSKSPTYSRRFIFSLMAGAATFTLTPAETLAQSRKFYAKRLKGKRAPKIQIGNWLQGKTSTKGKPILLKFFATWCPVCRTSVKPLSRLQKELGSRVTVIAISNQSKSTVQRFLNDRNAKFSVGLDDKGKTFDAYGLQNVFPHFVLINSKGRVVDEGPMPVHNYARLKKRIKRWV
ncbi:MAG: TlpA family protein disulfide reductase [Alphaproteobacteria bacterium]